MSRLDDLAEKWVVPTYLEILHANYCRHQTHEKQAFQQVVLQALQEVGEADIAELLVPADEAEETSWREQLTASWLCGLQGWQQFAPTIGKLLLASEMCYAGQGFCFALACFATEESAAYLVEYLRTYLPQIELYYDQDWAMPALLWVDEQLGTSYAQSFLAPSGLWEQFASARTQTSPAQELAIWKQSFWQAMSYCQTHFVAKQ